MSRTGLFKDSEGVMGRKTGKGVPRTGFKEDAESGMGRI